MSFELDEIVPVSRFEEGGYASATACALDPRNVRPVHRQRICNQKRGNGLRRSKGEKREQKPLKHSRAW